MLAAPRHPIPVLTRPRASVPTRLRSKVRPEVFYLAAVIFPFSSALADPLHFRDATGTSGIHFVHTDGSSGQRFIVETVTAGLGLIDFDRDGYVDILFLTGQPLPGSAPQAPVPTNALYRNNHDGTFTDVTRTSGIGLPGYAMGCAVADYDNDGWEDVFITNYGRHRLFHNKGDGSFEDATVKAGLFESSFGPNCVGAGCLFLDYDRDGNVDLFVGNYLEFDLERAQPCRQANIPVYCSPRSYPMASNHLYHNNGDGTFTDVSVTSGIASRKGYTMGVVSSDFDGDGWPDIYVGNDVIENCLFRNKGNGTFEEIGLTSGVAYDQYGDPQGTMGANAGDYDGDGRFDLIVTDYQNQVNTLYRNLGSIQGKLQFQDVTVATGAGAGSRPLVTWGGGFADFDNDGIPEIFTAAGHLQDTVERYDGSSTYKQRNLLLQWRKNRYVEIGAAMDGAMQVVESSRGAVFGDLNNDGKVDLVIQNARAHPTVMMNETQTDNHWAALKLEGTRSNRSAIGAVVRVTAGKTVQVDEVRAGRGYQSAEDLRLHFGLGTNRNIQRLEINWPSGQRDVQTNVAADRILVLTESQSAGHPP